MAVDLLKVGKKFTTPTKTTGITVTSGLLNTLKKVAPLKKPLKTTTKIAETTKSVEPKAEQTTEVKTLPSGGQYNYDKTGKLVKDERAYGTLESKKGEERDHIIPVSLGGTSNDPNLQYLKSDKTFLEKVLNKPASAQNRQQGKMLVEWKAIDDYNKGNISLNEARQRVLNWNNQPESAYKFFASSFLKAGTDTVKGLGTEMAKLILPRSLEQKLGFTSTAPKNALVAPITTATKNKLVGQAQKEQKEYGMGLSKPKEFVKAVARGTETLVGDTIGNLLNWYGENLSNKPEELKLKPSISPLGLVKTGLQTLLAKTETGKRLKVETGEVIKNTGNKLRVFLNEATKNGWEVEHPYLEDKTIFNDPRNAKLISMIGESLPSLGLAAGVSAATGNPYAGASILGISQGADTYRNLREKGASVETANIYGAMDAIGSTILEKLPLDDILKGNIGMSAAKEGTQEAIQQVWSNLSNIWGGDNTRKYFDGVVESFIIGAASGGAIGAFLKGLTSLKLQKLEAQAKEAGVTDEQLNLIKEQAAGVILENKDKIEPILQQQLALPLDKTNKGVINKITKDTRKLQPEKTDVSIAQKIVTKEKEDPLIQEAKKYKTASESKFGVRFGEEVKDKAIQLYKEGKSSTQISKEMGISSASVLSWTEKAGIKRTISQSKVLYEKDIPKVIELYKQGKNTTEISKELNLVPSSVARWVKEAGITRSNSEVQAILAEMGKTNVLGVRSKVSTKFGSLNADSTYEAIRIKQLEADPNVIGIKRATRIPFGENKHYIPDLEIKYKDGSIVIEEIKPVYKLGDEKIIAKEKAAKEFYKDKNTEYRIITENDIGVDAFKNANLDNLTFGSEEIKSRFLNAINKAKSNTKSQLTDIWNKAQEPKEVISTPLKREIAIKKPIKQKKPDLKIRESSAYKKYKEKLGLDFPDKAEYEIAQLAEDRAKAFDFYEQNKDQSVRIAKGLDLPPEEILQNDITREVLERELSKPKEEQDAKLIAQVAKRQSLRLTRFGQEIASQKGAYSERDYQFFINKILSQRTEQALKIDYKKGDKRTAYTKQISDKAREVKRELNKRAAKIKSAEEIINSFIC